MKQISVIIFFFSILLALYTLTCLSSNKAFELIVITFGSLSATMIGVYWSMNLLNKKAAEDEKREEQEALLGSLKLIYSELDVNEINLRNVKKALEDLPTDTSIFYDNLSLLEIVILRLKTQAFYGTISSGDIREITQKAELFNPIQQAYFNMELTINAFITAKEFFKEFKQKKNSLPGDVELCREYLSKVIENLDIIIKLIRSAKTAATTYLEKKGTRIWTTNEIKDVLSV